MNLIETPPDTLTLITLACALAWVAYLYLRIAAEYVVDVLAARRRRRIARIEAELDAKAAELRRTILALADQLAAERDEASRAMTRAAFLASGATPPSD
ncbi:hypothetical protein EG850_12225 [Gulosibacter macacae]|uniref:Uncharacterized protein n=1 Tax=Gulosibacter macacae TaxID=2488791 RepID=A0A3P3VSA8_9MICO|nr:hypothetical protein [Gulosibacter macacae]RRJ85682.1 hypothetical protein EG850_12225 [Gulosibacter macacae]